MANPALNDEVFSQLWDAQWEVMTLQGTVNKSILLIEITSLAAIGVWNYADIVAPYMIPLILLSLVLALVIIFKKTTAPYLSPVYAILEWMVIWVLSLFFEAQFPGIVVQAVSLTLAVFFIMLGLYRARIIRVTEQFRSIIIGATGAIMIVYLISLFGSLTGWFNVPYLHDNGPIGIGISVFIVGIASFNLLLDFDIIERGVQARAAKYMEWYASFGLLITLIWLYLEILKLLSKIRSR